MFTTILKIVAKTALIFGASYAASTGAEKLLDLEKDQKELNKMIEENKNK